MSTCVDGNRACHSVFSLHLISSLLQLSARPVCAGNKGTKPTTAVAVAEALRGSPSKPKNKAKRTHTHDGAQGASATPEAAAAHAPGALPGTTSPQGPGSDRGVSPKILGIKKRVGTGTEAAMSSTGSAQAGTEGSGPSCLPPRVQPG